MTGRVPQEKVIILAADEDTQIRENLMKPGSINLLGIGFDTVHLTHPIQCMDLLNEANPRAFELFKGRKNLGQLEWQIDYFLSGNCYAKFCMNRFSLKENIQINIISLNSSKYTKSEDEVAKNWEILGKSGCLRHVVVSGLICGYKFEEHKKKCLSGLGKLASILLRYHKLPSSRASLVITPPAFNLYNMNDKWVHENDAIRDWASSINTAFPVVYFWSPALSLHMYRISPWSTAFEIFERFVLLSLLENSDKLQTQLVGKEHMTEKEREETKAQLKQLQIQLEGKSCLLEQEREEKELLSRKWANLEKWTISAMEGSNDDLEGTKRRLMKLKVDFDLQLRLRENQISKLKAELEKRSSPVIDNQTSRPPTAEIEALQKSHELELSNLEEENFRLLAQLKSERKLHEEEQSCLNDMYQDLQNELVRARREES